MAMNDEHSTVERSRLVDWVCIELIERGRRGESIRVEDYLAQYPQISDTDDLLDLIDAEICVRRELKKVLSIDQWSARFPEHMAAIRQLMAINDQVNLSHSEARHSSAVRVSPKTVVGLDAGGLDWSVDGELRSAASLYELPLSLPQGFIFDSVIAKTQSSWLVRCHDDRARESFAFRIVCKNKFGQSRIEHSNLGLILDACEQTTKVTNNAWVAPVVAKGDANWIGVMRPWCFGNRWPEVQSTWSMQQALRYLAEIAFCLQSAHQQQVHHGHVAPENLFIDHKGELRITDPLVSSHINTFGPDAIQDDAYGLLGLIASFQLDPKRNLAPEFLLWAQRIVNENPTAPLVKLGEWMLKWSDRPSQDFRSSEPANSSGLSRFVPALLFRRRGNSFRR
jgi:hypothetical protein